MESKEKETTKDSLSPEPANSKVAAEPKEAEQGFSYHTYCYDNRGRMVWHI